MRRTANKEKLKDGLLWNPSLDEFDLRRSSTQSFPFTSIKKRNKDEIEKINKVILLKRIEDLERYGVKFTQKYDLNSDYHTMSYEYESWLEYYKEKNTFNKSGFFKSIQLSNSF
jgi:hypothetical protein